MKWLHLRINNRNRADYEKIGRSNLPVYKTFRRSHQVSIYVAEIVERNTAAEQKGQVLKC